MERLRLELSQGQYDFDNTPHPVTNIFIENKQGERNLIDILKEVEIPLILTQSGSASAAGGYEGPPPKYLFQPFDPFNSEVVGQNGKTTLLVCRNCGDFWCWPMIAKVEKLKTEVIWSEFTQPHRAPGSASWEFMQEKNPEYKPWAYSLRFVFDRSQYEEAISLFQRTLPSEYRS